MNQEFIDSVLKLWKLDDSAWLKQRRSEWEFLAVDAFSKASKRELAIFKKFYLKGIKDGYIEANTAFLLCPFTTPEEAKLVFYSSLFGPREREKILVRFVFFVMPDARSMPWGVSCVKSFCGGVLGKEYHVIHSTDMLGAQIASPSPGFFCDRYCYFAVKLMKGQGSYHGCLECFDYFLSALRSGVIPREGLNNSLFSPLR